MPINERSNKNTFTVLFMPASSTVMKTAHTLYILYTIYYIHMLPLKNLSVGKLGCESSKQNSIVMNRTRDLAVNQSNNMSSYLCALMHKRIQ